MTETEALRDALAALNDWERDFADLFALEVSEELELREPRAPKAPYARREKRELEATIRELTQQIEYEKAKREVNEDAVSVESKALRIECRSIATRQRDESVRARVENAKLREVFVAQRDGALRMERLVQRASALANALPREPVVSFDLYDGPKIDPLDHLAELEDLIDTADGVFATDAFRHRHTESYRVIRVEELDPDLSTGIDVVLEMGWALPFSVDVVADVLWTQATSMTNATNAVHFTHIHAEPTALVSRFISVPLSKSAMPLGHGQVATMFAPTEAADSFRLFVSRMYSQNVGEKKWLGNLRSNNWYLVERADRAGSGSPLSRIKMARRVRVKPLHFDEINRSERIKWVRKVMKGRLHRNVNKNLEHGMQSVGNALLSLRLEERAVGNGVDAE